jgi:hypothetical protein
MHRMAAAAGFEFREDLARIAEGEIVQHHRVIGFVACQIVAATHDQRRGEEELLLQAEMRMHPVRAGSPVLEVVGMGGPGGDRILREWRHAVLRRRRREPMPMDDRRLL